MFLDVSSDSFIANHDRHNIPNNKKVPISSENISFSLSLAILVAWCFDVSGTCFTFRSFYIHWICSCGKGSLLRSSLTDAVSKGYRKLIGHFTAFLVSNNKVAAQISPSLLSINSIILPNFHAPLVRFFLRCTICPIFGYNFDCVLVVLLDS